MGNPSINIELCAGSKLAIIPKVTAFKENKTPENICNSHIIHKNENNDIQADQLSLPERKETPDNKDTAALTSDTADQ